MPVDHLFRSLAEDQDSHAIRVVLSGWGTDGTLGLEAIKAAGGIAMAQEETTARHASMLHSAIASGCIDVVLTPEGIAAELTRIGPNPYLCLAPAEGAAALPGGREAELARLFALLRTATGVDFTHYKWTTLTRRIELRMALRGLERREDFLRYLGDSPAEVMPRLDDRGTLKQIRALQPEACGILMIGNSEQEALSRFPGEPSLNFLQKPFTAASLLAQLRQVLESRRPG